MKLVFSTRDVPGRSFLNWCETAVAYGFDGFEIHDPLHEKRLHADSLFRPGVSAASRRKLVNRHLTVTAVTSGAVTNETDPEGALSLVESASAAGVPYVILRFEGMTPDDVYYFLSPAVRLAEERRVTVLIETAGSLCDTSLIPGLINRFLSAHVAAAWNTRETFFSAGETPETTITHLGAHIRYVALGDADEDGTCLLGRGGLPFEDVMDALKSLDYDGPLLALWNDKTTDPDLVLTHFARFAGGARSREEKPLTQYNRSRTGQFLWPKYDVLDMTFSQVLDAVADAFPDQQAFRYTTLDYTRTYREFREDVDRVALSLIALGVRKGSHVAIWATNVPQWFLTFWATVKIGAVLVTVNTAYKIHEAEYLLNQSDTHTLVMIRGYKDSDYKGIMEELCPELKDLTPGKPLFSEKLPFLRNVITVGFKMDGCLEWNDMLRRSGEATREELRRMAAAARPGDVCNMQYTSGTTGFPKGVMLTHRNIVNDGKIIGDRMDLSTADRMMIQVPMFHCFGMVLSMTSMMTHGGTLCPIPYYSPKSSLKCIHQEKITCFNGVPTMFIGMFTHADFKKTDFSHMRTGIMAGSNCPPDLMRRAAAEMNMREIISVYGQTEAAPGCTMGEVNEDEDHRVETVGSAFPGVECRIVDPETNQPLPDGENGEFVARGFNIMKGYYKMPAATREAIDEDGWLHSGDICMRTPDGYYKVTGRLKDMIIRGGENLYPREIEEFYLGHPKVKDVQVVGVPDPRLGEEACAWVILHDRQTATAEEMKAYGAERIAKHKVPRYFMFVEEFPMNAAGKIQKFKMRDQSVAALGLKA
ncbi:MAG: AMP-binding protein [Clostridia bacterium]|nr:AMP-binding protein [Clostridia bacterium]